MPPETTYIILRQSDEDGHDWTWQANVAAYGAEQAIRRHISDADAVLTEGVFVAIPERSWNPANVSTQVQRTVKFEKAETAW